MANRITKVYTKTGDDGSTGMADGSRVGKNSPVIKAIGDIDELNAVVGLLRAEELPQTYDAVLLGIQNDLFALGGELSMPEYRVIEERHTKKLEQQIDAWNDGLQPLADFILPAGNRTVALCHQARTVCRRAERSLIVLRQDSEVRSEQVKYLNRLSDYFFVAARMLAKENGINEVYWMKES